MKELKELKERLFKSFSLLLPRQQRKLIAITELLSQKKLKQKTGKIKIDFFGIWRDRPEMQNSTEWIKNLRKKEWNRK